MKTDYQLMPNEYIILTNDRVKHGGVIGAYAGKLLLTNLNLVYIDKGVFGNIKGISSLDLKMVKIFNGQAQVLQTKARNGIPQLEVYHMQGQEAFSFQTGGGREIQKWRQEINRLLTGNDLEDTAESKIGNIIPGADIFADTLKGTMDTFKGALGMKSTSKSEQASLEKVAEKCSACGANLTGNKGQKVRCNYCQTEQVL